MAKVNSSYRHWLIACSSGFVGTVLFHLAQFSSRFDTFFGDRGDPRGVVYFCEHWYQALLGNTNLLSPGIFYPTRGTLAYTDLLLGFAVPYSVVRAAGFDMFTSVEAVVIGLNFLNYLVCFMLLNKMLRFGLLPSVAGAIFFAFNSPKFFQLTHLQLQFVLFLPLIFGLLIHVAKKAESLTQKKVFLLISLAGLLFNLQLLTAFYHAWFFAFWSFLFLALALCFRQTRMFMIRLVKKYWRALAGSAAVFLIGLLPFLLIYLPTIRHGNWYAYANVSDMIPSWWSMLMMSEGNFIWGWLTQVVRPHPLPTAWNELNVGVGLIPTLGWIALTVFALRLAWRNSRVVAGNSHSPGTQGRDAWPGFLVVTILATSLFFALGFKYWDGYSPWRLVYAVFPGAAAIRAMSRYVIFLALPMAIAFAFVLDRATKAIGKQTDHRLRLAPAVALAVVTMFGVVEQFGLLKYGGAGFSKRTELAYLKAMSGKLPDNCEAFYIAPGRRPTHAPIEYQDDAMLISILTGVPTLNGASSQFPPNWLLYVVTDPAYEVNVRSWIDSQRIKGNVCRLEIGPQVEAFDNRTPHPLDDPTFFVTQQYHDLLNREPTAEEIDTWVSQLKNCKRAADSCDRAGIALKIMRSAGYYDLGSFIVRIYSAGFGRIPTFDEFTAARQLPTGYSGSSSEEIAENNVLEIFVGSAEFKSRYGALANEEFERELTKNLERISGAPVALPDLSRYQNNRDEMLRRLARHDEFLLNRSFVALQYFAYLRRNPDEKGFLEWLNFLNQTGDFKRVTEGFITSPEYRMRVLPEHW
jgi:hypothetical protein